MTRPLVERLGFGDGKGNLSFNKCCTFTALAVFAFAVVTRREPTWALLSFGIVVIGAGFGLKGYLAAVKQNTHTAATNANVTLTGDLAAIAKVAARRDPERGVDPT